MRWMLAACVGCQPLAQEHEPCGGVDGPICMDGLDCVSTMLCAVGPCPGTCLTPCAGSPDCDSDETCAAPEGWDEEAPYCLATSTARAMVSSASAQGRVSSRSDR
jgi:hypothetical protein